MNPRLLALVGAALLNSITITITRAAPPGSATPAPAPSLESMNKAFGAPLWDAGSIFREDAAAVAARLGLQPESETRRESSYRLYPDETRRLLGSQPYSIALYAETGQVTQISIIFINKGDYAGIFVVDDNANLSKLRQEYQRRLQGFDSAFRKEARAIDARLTALLGQPRRDKFGQAANTTERVQRWDWNGHSILLATPRDEYVAVRIVPSSAADAEGQVGKIGDAELRDRLAKRVVRRPNGDVIITELPMVNQGPKGFCVPATWERYLRYVGIPADMYVLAMAGQTGIGGGTVLDDMIKGVDNLAARYGRRLNRSSRSFNLSNVANLIDKGLPMMWSMKVHPGLNSRITLRSRARKDVTDWAAWVKEIEPARREVRKFDIEHHGNRHMCLIIGYNEKTEEIAVSDSWGPEFAERWMTTEEAKAVSQGDFWVIHW